jgi:hypothetical protein
VWFGRYVAALQGIVLLQSSGKRSLQSVFIQRAVAAVGDSCRRDLRIIPLATVMYDLLITEVKEGMKEIFYVT